MLERFPALLMARRNLSRNRLRSALAALGIVIGVFAIATLGVFGNVLQLSATQSLGELGNQVVVSPAADSGADTLGPREVRAVERAAEGRGTAIPLVTDGAVVTGGDGQTFATLYGLSRPAALFDARNGSVPTFHRQGALVGAEVADRLGLGVGSAIEVEGNRYRVVAVLAEGEGISPVAPGNAVILPEDQFVQRRSDRVVVRADSPADARAVAATVRERLNAREQRVDVFELSSVLDRINEFFALLRGFLLGLGAVSLVVAGVSIFNVMLMSTAERRGEIGLLRAVGVHKRDVLRMLLVEATLLGGVGGVVGTALSGAAALALARFTPVDLGVVLDPSNLPFFGLALGFGALVSLLSGLYPAWQAASERPVEALRD